MDKEIKERIAAINSGIIPEGYKKTKVGIVPVEWDIVKLADIMHNEQRPIEKPKEVYTRIGIRSHAKGTFHELVENPEEVNMDTLYVVKKDDFIVNITFAWEHAIALASDDDDGKLVSHRFPTYVFDNNSPLYYKYVFCQDTFRQRLELISPGGAGRNRVLNKTDFINLEIYRPPLPEQQKIAEILSTQDKLIELQEKKIEQLKELKKAYLQKMFPQKGSKYPELRFKGFTDPWEQRKFGDLGSVAMCKRIFKEQTTATGEIPFYKIGTFGGEPDAFISRELFEEYKAKFSYPEVGDMLISASGTIGRTVEYTGKDEYFQDSNIVWFKHDDRIDNSFLRCLYSIVKWSGIEGSTIKRLYNDNFLKTEFMLPCVAEQRKVGSFFSHLDTSITLHQRKSEQEKQKKKALMQLLLTGKVRCI